LGSLRNKLRWSARCILFADTIFNNITLNNLRITREDVLAAAKEIGVHDFIMNLPDNYDFDVKERGVMLGQRQLIAFLSLCSSNQVFLFWTTSSIDTYSEELIQRATETITTGRTSIVMPTDWQLLSMLIKLWSWIRD
jgi:ABC-type multidrug transport system fused ATPase/permease subunit